MSEPFSPLLPPQVPLPPDTEPLPPQPYATTAPGPLPPSAPLPAFPPHAQPVGPGPYPPDIPTQYAPGAPTPYASTGPYPYPAQPPGPPPTGAPNKAPRPRVLKIGLALVGAVVLIVGGVMVFNVVQEQRREAAYEQGIVLYDQGDYEEAYEVLSGLPDDYRDATTLARAARQAADYQVAEGLLEAGDYAGATSAFQALGSYRDASLRVAECEAWIAFEHGQDQVEAGDYQAALDTLTAITPIGSLTQAELDEWIHRCRYALAQALYEAADYAACTTAFGQLPNSYEDVPERSRQCRYAYADRLQGEGHFFDAYELFSELPSDYQDAPARAAGCVQPQPGNVELFHDPGFVSSSTDVKFEAASAPFPSYIKVYSGETLVSVLYVTVGGATTIQVPAGDYSFREANGQEWFGESDMFGDSGTYTVMTFDGGNESVHLDGNKIYTITLHGVTDGNVGSHRTDPDNF